MKIRPENPAANMLDKVEEVMVIAPIDAEEDEAQEVTEQYGNQRTQRVKTCVVRHFQFQHHDGDDNRHHAIAERFQPRFRHVQRVPSLQLFTTYAAVSAHYSLLNLTRDSGVSPVMVFPSIVQVTSLTS